MNSLALKVQDLKKSFGSKIVFQDLSFELNHSDSLAIVGASGCGKSTLLYILSGLLSPDSGQIYCDEKKTGKIAFILQDYGLFPWKTVLNNVSLGMRLQGIDSKIAKKVSLDFLEELNLAELKNRYPYSLSGGQAQRVAIARALVTNPKILLMDEAFSSLDAITREQMQELLLQLWQEKKFTIVFVTHSVTEALYLGHKILVLGQDNKQLFIDNPYFGIALNKQNSDYLQMYQKIYSALG